MLAGDVDSILPHLQPVKISCPIPGVTGQIGAYPLCTGSTPGEPRTGYLLGHLASEGSVLSAQQYGDFLRSWIAQADASRADEYGSGAVRLDALGCPEGPAQGHAGRRGFSILFSEIAQPPQLTRPTRLVLIFSVEYAPGTEAFRITDTSGGAKLILVAQAGAYGTFCPWQPPPK